MDKHDSPKIIKALLIQYYPKFKDIESNISTLTNFLSKYTKEDNIDLIIFPEMALTGYIFDDLNDIKPYLSFYNKGIQYDFASNLAKKLECYVFLGYPEKTEDNKYYNSCMIIEPNGNSLPSYRKHFLYKDDKTWCIEGDNFGYLEIQTKKGIKLKLGIGICMDINPYEFKAPWEAFEFGNFCKEKDVDIIVFPTNWNDEEGAKNTYIEIMHMMNYWLQRLEPMLKKSKKNKYFLAADRIGKEKTSIFIGCSCALKFSPDFDLINNFDKLREGVLECELKF